MIPVGSIIAEYRKKKRMSQKDLVLALGEYDYFITDKAVSKWEKNDSLPSIPVFLTVCKILEVQDIYETFLGNNPFNPLGLLNEDGRQKATEYIEILSESERYKKKECSVFPYTRQIRLFQLPASAGPGEFLDGDDFEMLEVGEEVPADADFGIRISGNSMEPRFVHGQIVWVHQQNALQNGDIGIFYLDGNAYCKKLHDTENTLSLISLNKDYAPILVTEDASFQIFGKVVG